MPLLVRLFILRRFMFWTLQIYGFFGLCNIFLDFFPKKSQMSPRGVAKECISMVCIIETAARP